MDKTASTDEVSLCERNANKGVSKLFDFLQKRTKVEQDNCKNQSSEEFSNGNKISCMRKSAIKLTSEEEETCKKDKNVHELGSISWEGHWDWICVSNSKCIFKHFNKYAVFDKTDSFLNRNGCYAPVSALLTPVKPPLVNVLGHPATHKAVAVWRCQVPPESVTTVWEKLRSGVSPKRNEEELHLIRGNCKYIDNSYFVMSNEEKNGYSIYGSANLLTKNTKLKIMNSSINQENTTVSINTLAVKIFEPVYIDEYRASHKALAVWIGKLPDMVQRAYNLKNCSIEKIISEFAIDPSTFQQLNESSILLNEVIQHKLTLNDYCIDGKVGTKKHKEICFETEEAEEGTLVNEEDSSNSKSYESGCKSSQIGDMDKMYKVGLEEAQTYFSKEYIENLKPAHPPYLIQVTCLLIKAMGPIGIFKTSNKMILIHMDYFYINNRTNYKCFEDISRSSQWPIEAHIFELENPIYFGDFTINYCAGAGRFSKNDRSALQVARAIQEWNDKHVPAKVTQSIQDELKLLEPKIPPLLQRVYCTKLKVEKSLGLFKAYDKMIVLRSCDFCPIDNFMGENHSLAELLISVINPLEAYIFKLSKPFCLWGYQIDFCAVAASFLQNNKQLPSVVNKVITDWKVKYGHPYNDQQCEKQSSFTNICGHTPANSDDLLSLVNSEDKTCIGDASENVGNNKLDVCQDNTILEAKENIFSKLCITGNKFSKKYNSESELSRKTEYIYKVQKMNKCIGISDATLVELRENCSVWKIYDERREENALITCEGSRVLVNEEPITSYTSLQKFLETDISSKKFHWRCLYRKSTSKSYNFVGERIDFNGSLVYLGKIPRFGLKFKTLKADQKNGLIFLTWILYKRLLYKKGRNNEKPSVLVNPEKSHETVKVKESSPNEISELVSGAPIPDTECEDSQFVEQKLGINNVGFRMLKSMGWTEGRGLGKQEEGRTNPVNLSNHFGKRGLGENSKKKTFRPKESKYHTKKEKKVIAGKRNQNCEVLQEDQSNRKLDLQSSSVSSPAVVEDTNTDKEWDVHDVESIFIKSISKGNKTSSYIGPTINKWLVINYNDTIKRKPLLIFLHALVTGGELYGLTISAHLEIINSKLYQPEQEFPKLMANYPELQMIVCILKKNNAGLYDRIKEAGDNNLVTQCVLGKNVLRPSPAIVENIVIKIDTKFRTQAMLGKISLNNMNTTSTGNSNQSCNNIEKKLSYDQEKENHSNNVKENEEYSKEEEEEYEDDNEYEYAAYNSRLGYWFDTLGAWFSEDGCWIDQDNYKIDDDGCVYEIQGDTVDSDDAVEDTERENDSDDMGKEICEEDWENISHFAAYDTRTGLWVDTQGHWLCQDQVWVDEDWYDHRGKFIALENSPLFLADILKGDDESDTKSLPLNTNPLSKDSTVQEIKKKQAILEYKIKFGSSNWTISENKKQPEEDKILSNNEKKVKEEIGLGIIVYEYGEYKCLNCKFNVTSYDGITNHIYSLPHQNREKQNTELLQSNYVQNRMREISLSSGSSHSGIELLTEKNVGNGCNPKNLNLKDKAIEKFDLFVESGDIVKDEYGLFTCTQCIVLLTSRRQAILHIQNSKHELSTNYQKEEIQKVKGQISDCEDDNYVQQELCCHTGANSEDSSASSYSQQHVQESLPLVGKELLSARNKTGSIKKDQLINKPKKCKSVDEFDSGVESGVILVDEYGLFTCTQCCIMLTSKNNVIAHLKKSRHEITISNEMEDFQRVNGQSSDCEADIPVKQDVCDTPTHSESGSCSAYSQQYSQKFLPSKSPVQDTIESAHEVIISPNKPTDQLTKPATAISEHLILLNVFSKQLSCIACNQIVGPADQLLPHLSTEQHLISMDDSPEAVEIKVALDLGEENCLKDSDGKYICYGCDINFDEIRLLQLHFLSEQHKLCRLDRLEIG